jgi:D-alanyl-D-alanine carboxypeptidase
VRYFVKNCLKFSQYHMAIALSVLMTVAPSYSKEQSKRASIVVDVNAGKVLFASNADAPRHPASLTKMMTLYMIFDALEKGKITKNSQMVMSKHAASMSPTKLGIKAGGRLSVETAIYALVTKSANDAAAATAEFLGGSELKFAQAMTAKARSIGMKNTLFYNASGLPDPRQITTARDMAILGIALRKKFPQYYGYFSTRSFTFGRSRMGNHNKLLGRVAGVDGIKTGYTRASGFNLVSSVSLNNKRLVSVVLGGTSGGSRDAEMVKLIAQYIPKAATKANGKLLKSIDNAVIAQQEPVEEPLAFAQVKPAPRSIMSLTQEIEENEKNAQVDPITTASAPVKKSQTITEDGAWVIQIAASDSEAGALKLLTDAQAKVRDVLASAQPITPSVKKGSATLYRARFSGFVSKEAAWNACEELKKKNLGCFALNNN